MPPVRVLALLVSLLVLSPLARVYGQSPPAPAPGGPLPAPGTSAPPDLDELRLFFLHLANLEAAADQAQASGNPLDALSWRRYEQRAAGLTDAEGAILEDVAFRCNQALRDREDALRNVGGVDEEGEATAGSPVNPVPIPSGLAGPGRLEILGSALAELQTKLGPEAFQSLAKRVHFLLHRSEMAAAGGGTPPPTSPGAPGYMTRDGNPGPPMAAGVGQPAMSVLSMVMKMPGGRLWAECLTTPHDDLTAQSYAGATACALYGTDMAPTPIVCSPHYLQSSCVAIVPAGAPGQSRWMQGSHGALMQYSCPYSDDPGSGVLDPLRYCGEAGTAIPVFQDYGDVSPHGGAPVCWPGAPGDNCVIAATISSSVTFIDVSPRQATLFPGGEKQFTANIAAEWSLTGPGAIDQQGLYKAPPSITTEQTVTVKACDGYRPDADCVTASLTLKPLAVELSPDTVEVLPEGNITLSVKVISSTPGQAVEWSLSTRGSDPTGTLNETSNDSATYRAPADRDITATETITVKACVKPDAANPPVCATAVVIVPKIQIYIVADKQTLATGETERLTAYVNGSSEPRRVDWTTESSLGGELHPVSEDTLQADYTAPDFLPDFLRYQGVDIKVCLKDSEALCNVPAHPFHLEIVDRVAVTAVTGNFNAGQTAQFTVTGHGFGLHPTLELVGLQSSILTSTDTLIEGLAVIPVAMGGSTTELKVTVRLDESSDLTVPGPGPIYIAPASLSVIPGTARLHGGESQRFSALCLTASAAACTSPETISWQASPGTIDGTGLYTAPASAAGAATVKACWIGVPCATAQVTLEGASQSYPPTGWVEGNDAEHVWGWACDPDYPLEYNRVDLWSTNGQPLGSSGAFIPSSAAVTDACRGGTAHSFDFRPSGGMVPGTHFNVWSIDLPFATPGNDNRRLRGNGAIGDGTEFVVPDPGPGPSQAYPPIGRVEGYDAQHVWGWACDPDYPLEYNRVDFWSTDGQPLGSSGAFIPSSQAINASCRGGTGHSFDFYPSGGLPSGTHFNVWSIDLPFATPGNDNRRLSGNGAIGDGTEFVIP
jgi:hypothetical protein